jgi:hypothetical protein
VKTTGADPKADHLPDLVECQFDQRPLDAVWTDLTYLDTGKGSCPTDRCRHDYNQARGQSTLG